MNLKTGKKSYLVLCMVVVGLFYSFWLAYTPLMISVYYFVLSLLTLLLYAKDKAAAHKGAWRVSESTLHFFSVLGGWPGAILGQQLFRHKTRKISFRIVFWITLLVNAAALSWLHGSQGGMFLNTFIFDLEELVINNLDNAGFRRILLKLLSFHA